MDDDNDDLAERLRRIKQSRPAPTFAPPVRRAYPPPPTPDPRPPVAHDPPDAPRANQNEVNSLRNSINIRDVHIEAEGSDAEVKQHDHRSSDAALSGRGASDRPLADSSPLPERNSSNMGIFMTASDWLLRGSERTVDAGSFQADSLPPSPTARSPPRETQEIEELLEEMLDEVGGEDWDGEPSHEPNELDVASTTEPPSQHYIFTSVLNLMDSALPATRIRSPGPRESPNEEKDGEDATMITERAPSTPPSQQYIFTSALNIMNNFPSISPTRPYDTAFAYAEAHAEEGKDASPTSSQPFVLTSALNTRNNLPPSEPTTMGDEEDEAEMDGEAVPEAPPTPQYIFTSALSFRGFPPPSLTPPDSPSHLCNEAKAAAEEREPEAAEVSTSANLAPSATPSTPSTFKTPNKFRTPTLSRARPFSPPTRLFTPSTAPSPSARQSFTPPTLPSFSPARPSPSQSPFKPPLLSNKRRISAVSQSEEVAPPAKRARVFDLTPVPRVSLSAWTSNRPYCRTAVAALAADIPEEVVFVTSKSAASFRFPHLNPKKAHAMLEAASSLPVSLEWVENHWRWIVWKNASMDRRYFSKSGPRLTADRVYRELLYRYEREILQAQISPLRRLLERDQPPNWPRVFVIAHVDDDTLELSDGWYSALCSLDPPLCDLVRRRILVAGMKVVALRVTWLAEAHAPLEPPEGPALSLHYNALRHARACEKLGLLRISPRTPVALRSIRTEGGPIAAICVVIERVFPVVFMEKGEEKNFVRSIEAEQKQTALHEERERLRLTAIQREVQAECESEWAENEDEMNLGDCYDESKREVMDAEEQQQYDKGWETRRQRAQERQAEVVAKAQAEGARSVSRLIELRVSDAKAVKGGQKQAILRVWDPPETLEELLVEGMSVVISDVRPGTYVPRQPLTYPSPCPSIQSARSSLWERAPQSTSLLPTAAERAPCLLRNAQLHTEIDLVCALLAVDMLPYECMLYVCDYHARVLCLRLRISDDLVPHVITQAKRNMETGVTPMLCILNIRVVGFDSAAAFIIGEGDLLTEVTAVPRPTLPAAFRTAHAHLRAWLEVSSETIDELRETVLQTIHRGISPMKVEE